MTSAIDQLTGLGTLLTMADKIFGGGYDKTTTTSGGTTTSGQDISGEGIQRIIDQYMSGPGGVKDISGAARGAGLYNSTTEQQMLNDLKARAGGEAAKLSAKNVSTTSPVTVTQSVVPTTTGIGPLGSIASIGGLKAVGSLVDALSGGGASKSLGTINLGSGLEDSLNTAFNSIGGLTNLGSGAASGALGSLGSITAGPALESSLGTSLSASGGLMDAAGAGINFADAANPIVNLVSGFLQGKDAYSPESLGMSSIASAIALTPELGPLAFLVGPALKSVGGLFGGSIICTALSKRGLLDPVEYALGEEYLHSLDKYTIAGYYLWGTRVAEAINRGSAWAIALTLPWAASRMHLLASKSKWRYLKYPLGTFTKYIGQPACWLIGLAMSIGGLVNG